MNLNSLLFLCTASTVALALCPPLHAEQTPAAVRSGETFIQEMTATPKHQFLVNNVADNPSSTKVVEDLEHYWDQSLNSFYNVCLNKYKNEPKVLAALRTAQRTWIPYRDACSIEATNTDKTIKSTLTRIDLIKERIATLYDIYSRSLEEDMSNNVSEPKNDNSPGAQFVEQISTSPAVKQLEKELENAETQGAMNYAAAKQANLFTDALNTLIKRISKEFPEAAPRIAATQKAWTDYNKSIIEELSATGHAGGSMAGLVIAEDQQTRTKARIRQLYNTFYQK